LNIKVLPGGVGFDEQMHGDDGGTAALEFEWSAAAITMPVTVLTWVQIQ
jgi:hypothetical protein